MDARIPYLSPEFISEADLHGKQVQVTIAAAALEDIPDVNGNKKQRVTLKFTKGSKRLILNKTNVKTLVKLHGAETDNWLGKVVTLVPTECQAFGQTVPCVRIKG